MSAWVSASSSTSRICGGDLSIGSAPMTNSTVSRGPRGSIAHAFIFCKHIWSQVKRSFFLGALSQLLGLHLAAMWHRHVNACQIAAVAPLSADDKAQQRGVARFILDLL